MRLLFAGTPEIALPSLNALYNYGVSSGGRRIELAAVLTNPDAPTGRKRTPAPSPVKRWAVERDVPVLQPARLDGTARRAVSEYRPDLLVVVAYGKIFGPRFLNLFPSGGVNVHPSLLPRFRGPSPIPAAILAGDAETGVTVQRVALEMDSGEILAQARVPLPADATTPGMERILGERGAGLLKQVVGAIADGTESPRPQNHELATWCTLMRKEDGNLSWRESATVIERMVRAYTPWPGVRCRWNTTTLHLAEVALVPAEEPTGKGSAKPGTVLGVDSTTGILVQTVDGVLAVKRLKLQTRSEMDFRSFLNGNSSIIGSVLEQA